MPARNIHLQENRTALNARPAERKAALAIILVLAVIGLVGSSGAALGFWDNFLEPDGSSAWNHIPRLKSTLDTNKNGLSDTDDMIAGARLYVEKRPLYRSGYYRGGYPPETEGVCTDVVWAALLQAGYDLKKDLAADIRANRSLYPRVATPDSNIDFRRVPNLRVYFKRHGKNLTTTLKPGDADNLALWQPGDIVTFRNPDHIAILSDKRNGDGVPYLLHNQGPWASEGNDFMQWQHKGVTGHYRFPAR